MTNAIVPQEQAVVNVQHLANIVRALYGGVFKKGVDYGVIPGTGDKPTLLLPGMEKLMRAMNAVPTYRDVCIIRDYDKSLFHYEYECTLIDADTGAPIPGGRAIGLASSMESKWRWRNADRVCPHCGAATIKRSKYPPKGAPQGTEPGWYCYGKIGGCGAEFSASDPAITQQQAGRVENPDIVDQLNTITKIAQKRAMSSAVKGAANVSELFTVDLDDLAEYPAYVPPSRHTDTETGEIVTVTKPEPAPAPTPPTDDVFADLPQYDAPPEFSQQKAVIAWVQGWNTNSVSSDDLLAALGVTRFRDYAGTFASADQTVREFLTAKGRIAS